LVGFGCADCATAASNFCPLRRSPPIVEHVREVHARGAEDLALPPEESAITEMLAGDAMMREQAQAHQRS